ncbi:3'(2'),5'-bisphosphate nucleotidase CysQ [Antarctobacter heliothermus]|uniref:Myo-inositol-1(Or 4)-monophosphatase n=1 Tax=Antarctobacter heliothermus TaxID=74033 RepID=A0A239G7H7_9RHOB|nr:3'(2'),5'-bisphosphate nucleotidase CysQ [Antarctobacter heliothermus]SNS65069.1 myo-inositol-1(or 4)-monophosphatase [Antarctobacter heliothermus]
MPANDLALLIDAARQAGEIARSFVGGPLEVQFKAADDSPVTKADLAVNRHLSQVLRDARPHYAWFSEETPDDTARLAAKRVFIIDPIDGTRSFIEGEKTWAHALAVVENGRTTAAVIYLPMLDKLYSARLSGGAFLNERRIATGKVKTPEAAQVLATRASLKPEWWPGGAPVLRRSYRPSLAYRQSLVAEGRYDAMFTFRPTWEWDIAAGALILSEAGAKITDRHGAPLRFNAPAPQADGLVAANPRLHAALLDRLP